MGVGENPISGMCAQQFCEAGNWVWTVWKRYEVSGTRPEVSDFQFWSFYFFEKFQSDVWFQSLFFRTKKHLTKGGGRGGHLPIVKKKPFIPIMILATTSWSKMASSLLPLCNLVFITMSVPTTRPLGTSLVTQFGWLSQWSQQAPWQSPSNSRGWTTLVNLFVCAQS